MAKLSATERDFVNKTTDDIEAVILRNIDLFGDEVSPAKLASISIAILGHCMETMMAARMDAVRNADT